MKKTLMSVLVIMIVFSLIACIPSVTKDSPATQRTTPDANKSESTEASSNILAPNKTDLENLVNGNSAFAFDLYQTLTKDPENKERNLFFSPYSISLALAMAYTGARRDTERQMADTMHFTLPQNSLHPTLNSLNAEIGNRGKGAESSSAEAFRLNMANAIWRQEGYDFLPEFISMLNTNYDVGMRTVDFIKAPEDSRVIINDWVSNQTENKIKDLIPSKAIDKYTRIVLANAIYFDADWLYKFMKQNTKDDTFYLLDGSKYTVPMMSHRAYFDYTEGDDYQAVELRYKGNKLSMVILLPRETGFNDFEKSLDADKLDAIVNNLNSGYVDLTMPKFKFESGFKLNETLSDMGMPLTFTPMPPEKIGTCSEKWADFSGMTGKCELYITAIFHKAFVAVDEEGTEAAAATTVIGGVPCSAPPEPIKLTIDHPFIFLIRDIKTGTILFLGRVMDPSQ